jgi:hypothetical protein
MNGIGWLMKDKNIQLKKLKDKNKTCIQNRNIGPLLAPKDRDFQRSEAKMYRQFLG